MIEGKCMGMTYNGVKGANNDNEENVKMTKIDLVQYEIWTSELVNALKMKHQYLENARFEKDGELKEIYEEVAYYYAGNVESLSEKIESLKERQ